MEKNAKITTSVLAIVIIAGLTIGGYYYFFNPAEEEKTVVTVFLAGSLQGPFEKIEAQMELDNPNLDVQLQSGGSNLIIAWITSGNKTSDVLASADWSLIPKMNSTYQNYTIQFAINKMVLCYTNSSSKYVNEINGTNFWNYLAKPDVEWGFSDPNLDPCGYRTLMTLQLAEMKYGNTSILEDLVCDHANINVTDNSTHYNITCAQNLAPEGNVNIQSKSVDLITYLQSGELDYAFEYLSVAKQHNLSYIEFEDDIDLSNSSLDSNYKKVTVIQYTGSKQTASSITYGITVPLNAEQPLYGAMFIEYVLNGTGQAIFVDDGQPPISPGRCTNLNALPSKLATLCVQI